jgi:hypothetical protein
MTTFKTLLSVSSLAAIIAVPMMLTGAHASTTSKLMSCQANSKQGVIECCERILRNDRKPQWMGGFRGGCGTVVACSRGGARGARNKCYVYIPEIEQKGSPEQEQQTERSYNDID